MKLVLCAFNRIEKACKALIGIACLVFAASNPAFGLDKCGSLDRAANAIRLAQILYPELKGKEFSLQFSHGTGGILSGPSDVGFFLITVDVPEWHPPQESAGQDDNESGLVKSGNGEIELPFYLKFSFIRPTILGKTGLVVGRDLSCDPVDFMNELGSKQIHEAADVINAHPEWTDEEDLAAATKLGMRYGPDKKAAVIKRIPLKELSTVYGPLRIKHARFAVTGMKEPSSYFTDLHWYINAEGIGTPKRKLQIMVEPFDGKIIAISE